MTKPDPIQRIPTTSLKFDPDNPRFYRLNNIHSDSEVIEEMLDDENVQDLMLSIGQKGYFQGEPILVINDPESDGGESYIVVEGNRRLAAVKLLNKDLEPPPRRKNSINEIIENVVVPPPHELPCIVYKKRREVLRYLGYRHITGIKEWDSLSKAKYLAELQREFYPNDPKEEQLRSLANDIGSRSDYVGQLLTALMLYNQAENENFFGLPMQSKDVEFSYITTALNYRKIVDWLGLESRMDIEGAQISMNNLKKAFAWMFSKDQQGKTILGESRNLDQLADVVASEQAIFCLEETGRLSEAYLYTDGPESALEEAIKQANQRAQVVWNMLPQISPREMHLQLAESLFEKARSIRNHLREKLED